MKNFRRKHTAEFHPSEAHDPGPTRQLRRRQGLIEDVARELERRHGGNSVLNKLEAEILVDHYLDHDRRTSERDHSPKPADAKAVLAAARKSSV